MSRGGEVRWWPCLYNCDLNHQINYGSSQNFPWQTGGVGYTSLLWSNCCMLTTQLFRGIQQPRDYFTWFHYDVFYMATLILSDHDSALTHGRRTHLLAKVGHPTTATLQYWYRLCHNVCTWCIVHLIRWLWDGGRANLTLPRLSSSKLAEEVASSCESMWMTLIRVIRDAWKPWRVDVGILRRHNHLRCHCLHRVPHAREGARIASV